MSIQEPSALEIASKIENLITEHFTLYNDEPKYIFVSTRANEILNKDFRQRFNAIPHNRFMDIEVKVVDIMGIYAAVGGEF